MKVFWHLSTQESEWPEGSSAEFIVDRIVGCGFVDSVALLPKDGNLIAVLIPIVERLAKSGIRVWFATDGAGLDDASIGAIARARPFAVSVSLDSMADQRPERPWQDTSGVLQRLSEARSAVGSTMRLQSSFHLGGGNGWSLLQRSAEARVDTCCILPPLTHHSPAALAALLDTCDSLASRAAALDLAITLPVPPRLVERYRQCYPGLRVETSLEYRCGAGLHTAVITGDGRFIPCHVCGDTMADPLSSVRATALRSIYFSDRFAAFIQMANDPGREDLFPRQCWECAYRISRRCQPVCQLKPQEERLAAQMCTLARERSSLVWDSPNDRQLVRYA